MPRSRRRFRIREPADWKSRHVEAGWIQREDGSVVHPDTGDPLPKFGIDYPPERRAEAGEIVDDIPAESVPWLIEAGHIEEA